MRRFILFCTVLLATAIGASAGTANAVQPGLLEATLTTSSGGIYDPTRMTMVGAFITADFPALSRADVVDDQNEVLATMYPSSPAIVPEVSYMQADFTVDITAMHDYRLIAYDETGEQITVSNVQTYGPPPGPASLTAHASLDRTGGYTHLIDLTWTPPALPESIAQEATEAHYTFRMRSAAGLLVATGTTRADRPVLALTLGEPFTDDGVIVEGSTVRPGRYTVKARSIPTYALVDVPLGAATTTTVTVPPEPAHLTIADPAKDINRGQMVSLHGRLHAKYTDLRTPKTKIRVYTRASRSDDWQRVDTVTTGRHGRYTFEVAMHGEHRFIRAESTPTTSLRPAAASTTLVTA